MTQKSTNQLETIIARATRDNFGEDPYLIRPDSLGHRIRFSDSSIYDIRCVTCGETDTPWDNGLNSACQSQLPEKEEKVEK